MDEFDFEELIADMLGVTDEQREDDDFINNAFYDEFGTDPEQAFEFARKLLPHTPKVNAGLSGKAYHAFVDKTGSVMLMKIEAESDPVEQKP